MLYLPQFVSQSVWFVEKALLPGPHSHLLVSLFGIFRRHRASTSALAYLGLLNLVYKELFRVSEHSSAAVPIGTDRMMPVAGRITSWRRSHNSGWVSFTAQEMCDRGRHSAGTWTGFSCRLLNPGQAYFSSIRGHPFPQTQQTVPLLF